MHSIKNIGLSGKFYISRPLCTLFWPGSLWVWAVKGVNRRKPKSALALDTGLQPQGVECALLLSWPHPIRYGNFVQSFITEYGEA